jgi:hypothetical protein
MCTAQLSVSSPLSALNETPAVSPRVAVSALTEPESLGQPVPEKTIFVMVGYVGGAAKLSAGRARKKSDERMVTLMESQCSSGMVWYGATRV